MVPMASILTQPWQCSHYSLAIRARAKPNPLLTWRALHFRNFCNGRLGPSISESDRPDPPVARTKFLESFREEFKIGFPVISLEIGEMARFVNGAGVLGMEGNIMSRIPAAKANIAKKSILQHIWKNRHEFFFNGSIRAVIAVIDSAKSWASNIKKNKNQALNKLRNSSRSFWRPLRLANVKQ
ncbi:hypothetical protein F3Y22_tig00005459pilonHSYRG00016 [Hibiscus syriacus]|uniref:Uncharacterized protein n=1 Tax=Hibiscus syriacus TaxID=106335 RepID=A0A6A3CIP1_HIBSY|nr:hypothetical protein F3Y22_tig00005459pilonHSYRG00016 [Hibiscus syriacus]